MKVRASAPATMANIGPGFDILGCAFAEPADEIIAERVPQAGVSIAEITGDGGRLTRNPLRNTASVAAAFILKQIGARDGLRMDIHKGLPLASGLGSSAASAVAGAVAANAAFGSPLALSELLEACVEGEAAVSGRHADNVAPALFGGIVLVTGVTADSVIALPTPPGMYFALVTPDVAVPTVEARAVLPRSVALHDMVHQTGAVARLIASLYRGDLALMAAAMEEDCIIEPARAHLMPGLAEVRAAAAQVGGLATAISGAGPTLCTLCDSREAGERVVEAARKIYNMLGIGCAARVTTVGGGASADSF